MTPAMPRLTMHGKPRQRPKAAAASNPVTLFGLGQRQCRWPLWDDDARGLTVDEKFYCGAGKAGESVYCQEHREMAGGMR